MVNWRMNYEVDHLTSRYGKAIGQWLHNEIMDFIEEDRRINVVYWEQRWFHEETVGNIITRVSGDKYRYKTMCHEPSGRKFKVACTYPLKAGITKMEN